KPLPQGGPRSAASLLGGTVVMILILGVALAVFLLYCRQPKNRMGLNSDRTDLSPTQKLQSPPDRRSQLVSADIQGLHLEPRTQPEEDLLLQSPYHDMGVSSSHQPLVRMAES
uniref:Uncharacterized protein n=1 Tax=Jaculus jaculus TaxID=51337 RepID=A0A8C5P0K1_JACJA